MFTLRNERLTAAQAADWDAIALPLGGQPVAGGFAEQFASVRSEVQRFIENGAGAESVSPEGWWARQRLQPAASQAEAPAPGPSQQAFVQAIEPYAAVAAQRLGVAPEILTAHAALESGWGKHPLRRADGSDTFNLFGIKAGRGWRGEVNLAATSEYVNGQKVARQEAFRAYPSLQAAFADYAELLAGNPRYRAALGVGGDAHAFAQGLARGGYASDPAYADKLARLAGGVRTGE